MDVRDILRVWRRTSRKSFLLGVVSAVAAACDGVTGPAAPVTAAPPPVATVEIIKVSGDRQQGRPGDQLEPIIVSVRDALGKPVPGVTVSFAVTAGDGVVSLILLSLHGDPFVARYRGPAPQITDAKGEALALWSLGRHGENTVAATIELEGKPLQATFQATSVSSGYTGGSFALESNGNFARLYDAMAGGPYDCSPKSGSLELAKDGSFVAKSDFFCLASSQRFAFSATETGFYAVSGSTILLHYLTSSDTAGFLDPRDVFGAVNQDTITFSSYGIEWRYGKDNQAGPP